MPRRRRSPPSISASSARLLSLGHSQTLAGQICLEVEKQVINTWCQVMTVWRMLANFPPELFGRPLSSPSWTLVLPSPNNQHHFLTPTSFTAPSPYTSEVCLWTCLALIRRIASCTSQVAGLSIFVFISNDGDTVLLNTRVALDIQKTTDLDRNCARHLRSL